VSFKISINKDLGRGKKEHLFWGTFLSGERGKNNFFWEKNT